MIFQIQSMANIQAEIEKLLDVIAVILWKLSEIENEVVSDIKLILNKSNDKLLERILNPILLVEELKTDQE